MIGYLRYRWERFRNRRALRAERRVRPHGTYSDAASKAAASNWDKGGFFTK
jgi:hypothetical protein